MGTNRTSRGSSAGWPAAPLLVLIAFAGTWLGHTLEYWRVEGSTGLTATMTSRVHLYMLPLGVALGALGLVGGVSWLRGLTALATRLQQLQRALRQGRRLQPDGRRIPTTIAPSAHLCSLWLVLGLAQLALYVIQENLESVAAGMRAPGATPLVGQHWAAAPIQLLVAGALAALALPLIRRRSRLERAVGCHERLVAHLWGRRLAPALAAPAQAPLPTPHQRWGAQRWQRPPPVPAAA